MVWTTSYINIGVFGIIVICGILIGIIIEKHIMINKFRKVYAEDVDILIHTIDPEAWDAVTNQIYPPKSQDINTPQDYYRRFQQARILADRIFNINFRRLK